MHVQMNGGGRNCLVTSHGEERTTFPVILGLINSVVLGLLVTSSPVKTEETLCCLGQKNSFLLLCGFFFPKEQSFDSKVSKASKHQSFCCAKKTSTEDPLDEWCLIVNMLIENFIAAFTGSVLKHRRQLGMKP